MRLWLDPIRRPCRILGWLWIASFLSACSNEKTFQWDEELVLSTGEPLLVERATHYRRSS